MTGLHQDRSVRHAGDSLQIRVVVAHLQLVDHHLETLDHARDRLGLGMIPGMRTTGNHHALQRVSREQTAINVTIQAVILTQHHVDRLRLFTPVDSLYSSHLLNIVYKIRNHLHMIRTTKRNCLLASPLQLPVVTSTIADHRCEIR